jgi:hypothetical protein
VPAFGFVVLAAVVGAYVVDPAVYHRIMLYWMWAPTPEPFVDLSYITAQVRCWEQGVDVYVQTPCDIMSRPFAYSPLWLRASFLALGPAWTNWLALSLVAAFLLSLGLLPQPRARLDRRLVLAATFSCLPVYAMERANLDLVVFILALTAGLCFGGGLLWRILGYALCFLAGLLKFYPLALLITLLRERLVVCLALGLAAAAVVLCLVLGWHDELRSAMRNIPGGTPFSVEFGASKLVDGGVVILQAASQKAGLGASWMQDLSDEPLPRLILTRLLTLGAILMAWRIGRQPAFGAALGAIPVRAVRFLVIGAVLICGCFFVGQSTGYRGVFLLFAFPAIAMLAREPPAERWGGVFGATVVTILLVLWAPLVQRVVGDGTGGTMYPLSSNLGIVVWVVCQLAWWWSATVLLAVLVSFGLTSQAWDDLLGLIRRSGAPRLPQHASSETDGGGARNAEPGSCALAVDQIR